MQMMNRWMLSAQLKLSHTHTHVGYYDISVTSVKICFFHKAYHFSYVISCNSSSHKNATIMLQQRWMYCTYIPSLYDNTSSCTSKIITKICYLNKIRPGMKKLEYLHHTARDVEIWLYHVIEVFTEICKTKYTHLCAGTWSSPRYTWISETQEYTVIHTCLLSVV